MHNKSFGWAAAVLRLLAKQLYTVRVRVHC